MNVDIFLYSSLIFFASVAFVSSLNVLSLRRRNQSAEKILLAVKNNARGIHKRLDELEELENLLRERTPELIRDRPWVTSWIEAQAYWMKSLILELERADAEFRKFSERKTRRYGR